MIIFFWVRGGGHQPSRSKGTNHHSRHIFTFYRRHGTWTHNFVKVLISYKYHLFILSVSRHHQRPASKRLRVLPTKTVQPTASRVHQTRVLVCFCLTFLTTSTGRWRIRWSFVSWKMTGHPNWEQPFPCPSSDQRREVFSDSGFQNTQDWFIVRRPMGFCASSVLSFHVTVMVNVGY